MRVLLCFLLATSGLFATAYTGSVSGNWDSASTWGGAGVPGNGDTASINDGITVTIQPGTVTIGTSVAGNTAIRCSNGVSGTCVLNTAPGGATVILRGNVLQGTALWTFREDTTIKADSTAAADPAGTQFGYWQMGSDKLALNGTAGHPVTLTIVEGSSYGFGIRGLFQGTYVNVDHWGTGCPHGSGQAFISLPDMFDGAVMSCDHCTFDWTGCIYTGGWFTGTAKFDINHTKASNCRYNFAYFEAAGASQNWRIQNSVFTPTTWNCSTFLEGSNTTAYMNNVVTNAVYMVQQPGKLTDVLLYSNNPGAGGPSASPWGTLTRISSVRGCTNGTDCSINPHFLDLSNPNGITNINGVFFDFEGTTNQGDEFQMWDTNANGTQINISGLISGLNKNGISNGVGFNLSNCCGANTVNARISITKSTFFAGSPGSGGGTLVWAVNSGSPNSIGAGVWQKIKDNIVCGRDNESSISYSGSPAIAWASGSFVDVDYNAKYGLSNAPYYGPGANGNLVPRSAFSVEPGTHDINAQPGWLQARNFLTFCSSHDRTITTFDQCAAKFAKMLDADFDNYYTPANLYRWVQAGYAPTNPKLFTAASDGTYVGATPPSLQFGHATISAQ